ncbi:hypothetical protein, partial [uncultured Campylobacter sp.]|uniref:hypothetical protein n=1 Tax=uncultured Campylobacter sp. TaxID=218934 RepID=UPI00261CEBE5
ELRGAPAPLPTPTRATLAGRATLALNLNCGLRPRLFSIAATPHEVLAKSQVTNSAAKFYV